MTDYEEGRPAFKEFVKLASYRELIDEWEDQLRHWYKHADKDPTFEEVRDRYFELKQEAFRLDKG